MAEQNEATRGAAPADILALLQEAIEEYEGDVERITIERATRYHYAARVYLVGQDEFDGYQLTLEHL